MNFEVEIKFHGDLGTVFLPRRLRTSARVLRKLSEKTSIKDVIEACGVPHPEVDLIILRSANVPTRMAVDFRWQLETSGRIDVYGFPAPEDILPSRPRLQRRRCERFVVDGHLGGLARNLRLLGLDSSYEPQAEDHRLLQIMSAEERAILTRDRRLLMHSIVTDGFCPRSHDPEMQTTEVLRRFGHTTSSNTIAPFTRCLECNGLLRTTPKQDVANQLAAEPRTLRYYDHYRVCAECGRIYWPGSHFSKLAQRVARLVTLQT
jgi:uncharacterized protein with PIN domain